MKYLLIAAVSIFSLNSFAGWFDKKDEEKKIERQEERVRG